MKAIEYYLTRTVTTSTGCMEWTGARSSDGYPRVGVKNGNGKLHRLVYEHTNKKSIEGLVVRHICDNPICINPDHLKVGTLVDNVNDRTTRGRTYHQVSKSMYSTIISLRNKGHKIREIACKTGLSFKQVDYILYRKRPV